MVTATKQRLPKGIRLLRDPTKGYKEVIKGLDECGDSDYNHKVSDICSRCSFCGECISRFLQRLDEWNLPREKFTKARSLTTITETYCSWIPTLHLKDVMSYMRQGYTE